MQKKFLPLVLASVGILLLGTSFFVSPGSKSDDMEIEVVKTSHIMPAAHNVYANKEALDGKYYLFKAKLTNKSGKMLEDVKVRYRVPGFIDWTDLEVIGEMYSGQSAVVLCYPKFEEKITEKTTESRENVEIEVTWKGLDEDDTIEESFSFRMTNRNEFMFTNLPNEEISEWSDIYDNDVLLACFVTPNDPIVQYYTQNIQEKILMGEAASVTKDPNEAVRFLAGIYQATLQSGMVYSGTKGTPSSLQDYSQLSQHNRLPREVITGNTGLCLELSLLYASVLSNAGLEPIIFLIPGHAYPGFKLNGQYYAIEATGIGGQGLGNIASVEQAFEQGMKQLQEFMQYAQMGDPRYTLVDIHLANQNGVTPMNLPDDAFLRKKVDDIVASWSNSYGNNSYAYSNTNYNTGGGGGGYSLSFTPPSGWQVYNSPYAQLPILTAQAISPTQEVWASIFDVPTNNAGQVMQTVQNSLADLGQYIQYQINGNQVSGITSSSNGNVNWVGKIVSGPRGLRLVTVGTYDYLFNQNSNTINQVFNSIR